MVFRWIELHTMFYRLFVSNATGMERRLYGAETMRRRSNDTTIRMRMKPMIKFMFIKKLNHSTIEQEQYTVHIEFLILFLHNTSSIDIRCNIGLFNRSSATLTHTHTHTCKQLYMLKYPMNEVQWSDIAEKKWQNVNYHRIIQLTDYSIVVGQWYRPIAGLPCSISCTSYMHTHTRRHMVTRVHGYPEVLWESKNGLVRVCVCGREKWLCNLKSLFYRIGNESVDESNTIHIKNNQETTF